MSSPRTASRREPTVKRSSEFKQRVFSAYADGQITLDDVSKFCREIDDSNRRVYLSLAFYCFALGTIVGCVLSEVLR